VAWYEQEVPTAWAFWSPARRIGIWQAWSGGDVGAVFLGGIPSEPTVLALDLAHARANETIMPGRFQRIRHQFGRLELPPTEHG
jgi:hypothetical protein